MSDDFPPLPHHLNIVALESHYVPIPPISVPPPHTFTLTTHFRTTPVQLLPRIRHAHIIITTTCPLPATALAAAASPHLRLITSMSVGTDSIDLEACRARGISVCVSTGCNTRTVAEHTLALAMALRRAIVPTMRGTLAGAWKEKGTLVSKTYMATGGPPTTLRQETVGIIGYGALGKALEALFTTLGSRVLIAARKNSPEITPGRHLFTEVLQKATLLIICCPRTPETLDLIGPRELSLLPPTALLVNVARGGIVDEHALLSSLLTSRLSGAAVDVFAHSEPLGPTDSPLFSVEAQQQCNLIVTPHTAWISRETIEGYQQVCQENIIGYCRGVVKRERAVVQGVAEGVEGERWESAIKGLGL